MKKKVKSLLIVFVLVLMVMLCQPISISAYGDFGVKISSSVVHTMIIMPDKTLWAWGGYGQVGNPGIKSLKPVYIMDDIKEISSGGYHNLALKEDGTLWAWGTNYNGAVGDGTFKDVKSPIKIMEDVVAISAGTYHSLAIKDDGSLWAWGQNSSGQLGNGNTDSSGVPIKVMDSVMAVSGGTANTMVIKTDNSLWGWGSNSFGQLGDGTLDDSLIPIRIMDDVISVSSGENSTCAIKSDGSLWNWGKYDWVQSGNLLIKKMDKKPIKIDNNVKTASKGSLHTMYIKMDGSLWAYGKSEDANAKGQFGNGTLSNEIGIPVKIMNKVLNVSCGSSHTFIEKIDGSIWGFGYNENAQLGDGTLLDRINPVQLKIDTEKIQEISPDNTTSTTSLIPYGLESQNMYASKLSVINIFKGSDSGFELERKPTRLEGIIMMIRLLGKENDAILMSNEESIFNDVPEWGIGYVNYAYKNGLTVGVSSREFGTHNELDAKTYTTFLLRALGYNDTNGDFNWFNAVNFANKINLYEDGITNEIMDKEYTRGLLAICTYRALEANLKNTDQLLIVKLVEEDAISKEDAFKLGFNSVLIENISINMDENSNREYKIGETGPGGGIIFWIDENGRGLEITPFDLESGGYYNYRMEWSENAKDIPEALGKAIGAGEINTNRIVEALGDYESAAKLCYDLEFNGYNDWFLPSIDELNLVYENIIRADPEGWIYSDNKVPVYWSSSGFNYSGSSRAWCISLKTGYISTTSHESCVRAARYFE